MDWGKLDKAERHWIYRYFLTRKAKVRIVGKMWWSNVDPDDGLKYGDLRDGARLVYDYAINRKK